MSRQVYTVVLDKDEGVREETRSERRQREQREAMDAARREVTRLHDWRATLLLRETTLNDGIKEAQETITRNTHSLEVTRHKLKTANEDLTDARECLQKMERAASAK